MKEYIHFNTKKIMNSKNTSEVKFFKLMINYIYGKTCENVKKRINVKLINNSKDYLRCVSKPNFMSQKIFGKTFVAIHQIKPVLTLNKPIYVGFTVLELSKLFMCKFHHEYVCNKFDAKLLFTDTDSLVYEIKDKDVYEECFKDRELFDFSKYPKNLKYYDNANKKVLHKMKDGFNGVKLFEFIGLKSKCTH